MVLHWILQYRLYRRLRKQHPEAWAALGSPNISTIGLFSRFSYLGFVWLRRRGSLADSKIDRQANALRCLDALGWTLIALLVFLHFKSP